MNHPGMGVMIGMLGGNRETVDAHKAAMGKTIEEVWLDKEENRLMMSFTDGTGIMFYDDGQSCCEERWMATDDNLDDFAGATFIDADLRDGPTELDEWGDPKESQFLLINTSLGTFTMVNYNEHNGYYGGFLVVIREMDGDQT